MKCLIYSDRSYYTDFFFLRDIFVLNTPFSSPNITWGRKTLACILPSSNSNTLAQPQWHFVCRFVFVFEWVWGQMDTRPAPVLQHTRYLPIRWIHWGVQSGTGNPALSPQTLRVHTWSPPGDWICFHFCWSAAAVRKSQLNLPRADAV